MGCFCLLIMAGVYQDGWAHNHGLVDQSFLTPWHAILYATMAVTGLALGFAGVWNLTRGYSVRSGLPIGYWTSAIGVVVFLAGGAFDLWWHTRFGIEVDIEGLISPSHLTLALGGMLVFAGTLRAVAARYGPQERRWRAVGPALLSGIAVLMLLGFFTQYASPLSDDTLAAVLGPAPAVSGNVLYSVRANGASETRIANMPGKDILFGGVSPDGKRIAARVQDAGAGQSPPSDIYVMNADGSAMRRITRSGRHDTQPVWSRDGKAIAYISLPAQTSGEYELHVVQSDGRANVVVAHGITRMLTPVWSPDDRAIAVASRNGVIDQIAVYPLGGGPVRWIAGTQGAGAPAWAPDGTLAFEKDNGVAALSKGANLPHALLTDASRPVYSAGGRTIAFLRQHAGETQVFLANANGTGAREVSGLSGLSASAAGAANSVLFFSASGHQPALQTGIGKAYGMDAAIVSSVILMGVVLLFLRRWRAPLGGMTLLIGTYAIAMNTQADLYYLFPSAIVVAILADMYLAVFKERARSGLLFYAFAFAVPALSFALYEYSIAATSRMGWPFDLATGSPAIAGFAGLLVAFCYSPPLAPVSAGTAGDPALASVPESRATSTLAAP